MSVGTRRVFAWMSLLGLIFLAGAFPSLACDEVPVGTVVWLKLTSNLSSFDAKPGTRVEAILADDIKCGNEILFPIGTRVEGEVHHVQKVGWGIRHETASIDVQFNQLIPGADSPAAMSARVVEVENARESVKKGVIHGIRATDTPQGRISSRLKHLPAWNPYTDMYLIAFKVAFPIFPEPEIYYGPGTDLKLELMSALKRSPSAVNLVADDDLLPEDNFVLDEIALSEPERTYTREHKPADVINLALIGSSEQVENAFHSAEWVGSDKVSKRSVLHQFAAILDDTSYVRAPMMPMVVGNAPPEMKFQKSLNGYSKRDHLRVWKSDENVAGSPVWLAAATHDVSASLSVRRHKFMHHIEPDIDQERAKIIRDLRLAGCVESVHMAPRPDMPHQMVNATWEDMRTDGELAVVRLKDCSSAPQETEHATHSHPSNRAFRYVRDRILTVRSDIWRANIIYAMYDLGRMMWTANSHQKTQSQIQTLTAKEGGSVYASPPPLTSVARPTAGLNPDTESEVSPIY